MKIVSSQPYRFLVVGNDLDGWSIAAILDSGKTAQLAGVYASRRSAVMDIARVAEELLDRSAPHPADSLH